jgi:hypothetical protein
MAFKMKHGKGRSSFPYKNSPMKGPGKTYAGGDQGERWEGEDEYKKKQRMDHQARYRKAKSEFGDDYDAKRDYYEMNKKLKALEREGYGRDQQFAEFKDKLQSGETGWPFGKKSRQEGAPPREEGASPMQKNPPPKSNYSKLSVEERANVHGMNLPKDAPMTDEQKSAENYEDYKNFVQGMGSFEHRFKDDDIVYDLDDPIYDDVREKFKYNPERDYKRMKTT